MPSLFLPHVTALIPGSGLHSSRDSCHKYLTNFRPASRVKRRSFYVSSLQRSYAEQGIPSLPARRDYAGKVRTVLLQGFNWDSANKYPWWDHLLTRVDEISDASFSAVWLPPCSQSADSHGYLPRQLYNLDQSPYGTSSQLRSLISALKAVHVRVIADVAVHHGSATWQDEDGHCGVFEGGTSGGEVEWKRWAIVDNDFDNLEGEGAPNTGEGYAPAPDPNLDPTTLRVQVELTHWLKWLRDDVGFDGWRFDFAAGYPPAFAAMYMDATKPTGAVGEAWTPLSYDSSGALDSNQDCHRQVLCDWIDGSGGRAAAFDYTTKGILERAVGEGEMWRLRDAEGKAPGLIGWYPDRATTFLDTHATGSSERQWPFPPHKVMQGYAYILTHPGVPCVFYDHFFEWGLGEGIKELIQIRDRNGLHASSPLQILAADSDLYVARVDERVTVKIGPRMDMGALVPANDTWQLATSGEDYAVWEAKGLPYVPLKPGFSTKTTPFEQYGHKVSEKDFLPVGEPVHLRQLARESGDAYCSLLGEVVSEGGGAEEVRLGDERRVGRLGRVLGEVLSGKVKKIRSGEFVREVVSEEGGVKGTGGGEGSEWEEEEVEEEEGEEEEEEEGEEDYAKYYYDEFGRAED